MPRESLTLAIKEGAAKAFGDGADRYRLNDRFDQDTIDAMLTEQDRIELRDSMPDYMKDKQYYDAMMDMKTIADTLSKAELIGNSLRERWSLNVVAALN